MSYGVDVAKCCKEFTNVHQGSIIVGVDVRGNASKITPEWGSVSGVGYLGIIPSGTVIEGKYTDRFDNPLYY